jgi:ssDNA-binding Zn-finger/Zn-ribbon topoisomerase 1
MREVKITGECDKCGRFEVIRKRGKRVDVHGRVFDLPRNVVCPTCRMWGEIVKVEEIIK